MKTDAQKYANKSISEKIRAYKEEHSYAPLKVIISFILGHGLLNAEELCSIGVKEYDDPEPHFTLQQWSEIRKRIKADLQNDEIPEQYEDIAAKVCKKIRTKTDA